MSLILDALKKAEQDRHAGQAPVLDEVLVRRAPPAVRRTNPQQEVALMAGAIAAVLFAVSGLVYWLWPAAEPLPAAGQPAATIAPTAPAAEPAVAAGPALRIDPERLQAPVAAVEEPVETGDTGAVEATTLDDLDGDTPAATVRPPAPAPELAAVTPPPPQSVPAAAEPAARPLKEMPPAFRNEFPRLTVDVHVYDHNPLRRFVLINGKKYRESDTLIDGPRVVEITPAGVVVEQRGSKVLLELPR